MYTIVSVIVERLNLFFVCVLCLFFIFVSLFVYQGEIVLTAFKNNERRFGIWICIAKIECSWSCLSSVQKIEQRNCSLPFPVFFVHLHFGVFSVFFFCLDDVIGNSASCEADEEAPQNDAERLQRWWRFVSLASFSHTFLIIFFFHFPLFCVLFSLRWTWPSDGCWDQCVCPGTV